MREPLNRRSDGHHRISVRDGSEDRKSRGSRGSNNINNFERGSLLRASFRASSLGAQQSPNGKGGPVVTDPSRDSGDLEASLVGLTADAVNKARSLWGRNEIPEVRHRLLTLCTQSHRESVVAARDHISSKECNHYKLQTITTSILVVVDPNNLDLTCKSIDHKHTGLMAIIAHSFELLACNHESI